jgi:hypothetical protein
MNLKLEHCDLLSLDWPDLNIFRMIYKRLRNSFNQLLHVVLPNPELSGIRECERASQGLKPRVIEAAKTAPQVRSSRRHLLLRPLLKQAPYRLGRLGAYANPICNPLMFKRHLRQITSRIIGSHNLNETSVAGFVPFDDDNPIAGLLPGPSSC